jgi:hypothetical protein
MKHINWQLHTRKKTAVSFIGNGSAGFYTPLAATCSLYCGHFLQILSYLLLIE